MNMYYSVPLNVLIDSEGNPLQAVPQLAYGDVPAIVFTALDADNEPVDLSSATKWRLTVDVDRTVTTPHLCEVPPEEITYDATAKTLSYHLNTRTLEFFVAVDGKSQVALIAELCGFDSTETRLFRFSWDMTGVMPVDAGQAPDSVTRTAGYTAFEVYANADAIAAGTEHPVLGHITTAIPAMMTEKFTIRANYQHADSDIIVDWGDGSSSVLRNGEFESEDLAEWDKEHQFEVTTYMAHTYAVEGKYVIKVHGKKYFSLSHGRTQANNLMCRCLETDLPLSTNINNLSYFAANAQRLVNVCIPTAMDFRNIENLGAIFQNCSNLQYAYGLKRKIRIPRASVSFFYNCGALIETDFVLPVCSIETNTDSNKSFSGCSSLITPIQNLLPSAGFCNRVINVLDMFKGCGSLTGTVPVAILWEDTSKVWQNTDNAFTGASVAIREQVPTAWGGTNTEIVV